MRILPLFMLVFSALTCISCPFSAQVLAQEVWARFRGPNGTGMSTLQGVPTNWTASDYEWVVDLPGKGHSSPVIWGEHLFLTSGEEDGERKLICLNAFTGKQLWSTSIKLKANRLHTKNSYGSGSPATDGERVYVAEADSDHFIVMAHDMQGKEVWRRDLGACQASHGMSVSPIIYQDLLIVPNDQDGPSFIEALDLQTGLTRWKTPRKIETASYATPIIVNLSGQDQLVALSGATGLAGLNPLTGEELWASGPLPQRTVASPVYGNGLLFATCGQAGRGVEMIAVHPVQKQISQSLIAGIRKQSMPYVPTPVIVDNYLYLWNDDGTACCVDLRGDVTKNVWRKRLGGNYSGSPVVIDGRIYCISEDGNVKVIDASPKFQEYPGGQLNDPSYSTPAIANGRVYLRSFHKLTSLKSKNRLSDVH